jgi:hypothetical protein
MKNNYDKAVIIMIFILILVSAVCKCQTNDTIKFPLNIQLIDGRNLHYKDYNELYEYTRSLERFRALRSLGISSTKAHLKN